MVKEKITLNEISDLLEYVGKGDNLKLFNYVKKKSPESFKETIFLRSFENEKEIMDLFFERIFDYLVEFLNEIKSKIIFLRKKGEDVNCFELELMRAPLKIKFFKTDLSYSVFENIISIFEKVEKEISDFSFEDY